MSNVLFRESGNHGDGFIGNYNFGDGKLWLPEVETLPATQQPDGAIFHVKGSGVIAVGSGSANGLYAIFPLDSLPFTNVAKAPNDVDNIVFYGEPSGMLNDGTASNPSGIKRWEPTYPSTGTFDTVAFNTEPTKPGLASGGGTGVWNGYNAGYYVQQSGTHLVCDDFASSFHGNDTPYTFGLVLMPGAGGVGAMGLIGCGKITTTEDLLQLGMDWASAGGQDAYSFRRDTINVGVSATGGTLTDEQPQMLIAVCSGTTISMYLNGSGIVEGAAYNVGSNILDRMVIGATTRNDAVENPFTGFIFEVCMFDAAIVDLDREAIELYWADRYDITL